MTPKKTAQAFQVEEELLAIIRRIDLLMNDAYLAYGNELPDHTRLPERSQGATSRLSDRLSAVARRVRRNTPDYGVWDRYEDAERELRTRPYWTPVGLRWLRQMTGAVWAAAGEALGARMIVPPRARPLRFHEPRFEPLLTAALGAKRARERREAAMVLADMLEEQGFAEEAKQLHHHRFGDPVIRWVAAALGYRARSARSGRA